MALELESVFVIDENAEEAFGTAHQKMDMARASGDERGRALGLIKAADALVTMDKPDDALGYVGEAMHMCNEMKYEEGRAAAMNVMTKIHAKKGRDEEELEEALDSAMDALKLFRKLGSRKGEAVALTSLSMVHQACKKAALAIKAAKEALAIFAELGDKRAMAVVYGTVKDAYLAKTPAETFLAAKQMEKAMALYKEIGDKSKEASCLHSIAKIESGDVKKAADAIHKAKDLYAEAGDVRGQAAVLETAMTMLLDGGLFFEAVKVGKQRATLFREAGDASEEGRALLKLGDVYMKNDDAEKAGKVGEVAIGIFAGVNDMEGMKSAKDLVDGAKHAVAVTEIEASISKASSAMHVPKTLIVDPGLNKRVTGAFGMAIAM
mmetsp:Transcript_67917/g.212454  ORF Transcript_67917/g.212454 Transcript_67917/m.212454 type:complete len:379 (-) Transcript_67917:85-1221(-)